MHILYIHQYFLTPQEPGGTRSYWVAQELIKNGHQVTMLTSSTKFQEEIKNVNIDGINVIYIKEDYDQNMSVARRLKAFVNFMYKASRIGVQQKNIDLVIATSTPLTIGVPALVIKWLKKTPYVFEVRDLWPEVPIQMGAFKNPLIIGLTRWLEKTIYKNAEHVIALSPGMQDGVVKYIPIEKTSMIPNMSKIDEFWPREKDYELMKKIGLNNDCLKVIHFGSLGEANGIDSIIESAHLLKGEKLQFLFLGGELKKSEKQKLSELQIDNVILHERTPMELTSAIVNCCDISLVSFKNLPILYTNSPNKLFDSLSAGKPIIVNSAGWTKDLVEKNECGFYYNPNKPQDLADKLIALINKKEELEKMGQKSRKLAEQKYDKSILVKQFTRIVNKIVNNH